MPQAGAGYRGESEVEPSEVGQPFQVLQPGVGDLRVAEDQPLEAGQPFEVLQPRVGDLREADVQPFEASPVKVSGSRLSSCENPRG